MIDKKYKRKLSMKIGGFFILGEICFILPAFIILNRKMLQIRRYITELLNVCYISMNTLDITEKKNKIVISKKGKV